MSVLIPCNSCQGSGQSGGSTCSVCNGAGEVDAFGDYGMTEAHEIGMFKLLANVFDKLIDVKEKVDEIMDKLNEE